MRHYVICLGLISWVCLLYGQNLSIEPSHSPQDKTLLEETIDFARAHEEFRDIFFKQNEKDFVRLVAKGQSPNMLFIGCSDSRVVPDLILNTRPGDLFVIRTAGNFVPPYHPNSSDGVAATIQFAVNNLNVKHIVVCGHSHCGAIKGLFQQLDPIKFGILKRWITLGEEAKYTTLQVAKPHTPKEELYKIAEQLSVVYQLEHLMTYPFIKEGVENGLLALHGWYFCIEDGQLYFYDPTIYRFKPFISKELSLMR